ncbi:hypothetical protein SAMN05421810_101789 [Amycolatopsis arida]|uniref:Glutaredoxin n=1 Tax=Amycolatopsis arida TaxID=587909 RepID=A0A1I5M467_9PSEU|nr:hypothetical protein [Amycolatopsis arida]TDX93964.1 hypothetical protein CLV69_104421 [Amycolatopsis arida]SFP04404.1 hypothetical protein SAMN05421810_101789 [Amycolatopsis arida]
MTRPSQGPARRIPVLRIYVAPGCAGCRAAVDLAAAVRRARPDQPVEVVDLGRDPGTTLPPGVVGTPAYRIGDEVVSLGNPEPAELLSRLDNACARDDDD